MIEELQLINYWLESKDPYYLHRIGLDDTYFFEYKDVVNWIEGFVKKTNQVPSIDLVASECESFRALENLDPVEYLVGILVDERAYIDYSELLISNANMAKDGKAIEAMWKMRSDLDSLISKYTRKITHYDWVKHALDRFNQYMEKHGQDGLAGISTGIQKLDELTGGWREDDLILVAGRTNEGKSLVGTYFAYSAWYYCVVNKINRPVIYITTEMGENEIAYRLDTLRGHFSNRALNEGRLEDPQLYKEYLEELSHKENSFLILSQESNNGRRFTPSDVLGIIQSERPVFVVIDQLYDLVDENEERDRRLRIVNISEQIREINLNTNTPIMLIAQANRDSAKLSKVDKNASPELHQIQESDNPAQKATRVITIKKLNDDVMKLTIRKNRSGIRDKDVFMRIDIDKGIWEESLEEATVF